MLVASDMYGKNGGGDVALSSLLLKSTASKSSVIAARGESMACDCESCDCESLPSPSEPDSSSPITEGAPGICARSGDVGLDVADGGDSSDGGEGDGDSILRCLFASMRRQKHFSEGDASELAARHVAMLRSITTHPTVTTTRADTPTCVTCSMPLIRDTGKAFPILPMVSSATRCSSLPLPLCCRGTDDVAGSTEPPALTLVPNSFCNAYRHAC